jgi:hypothetical protein
MASLAKIASPARITGERPLNTLFVLSPTSPEYSTLYPATNYSERLDSGVDIPTPEEVTIPGGGAAVKINLGVRALCVQRRNDAEPIVDILRDNHYPSDIDSPYLSAFRLAPRSSICKTPLMMANSEGIIDVGYRGPLVAAVRNLSAEPYTIPKGLALFQVVAPDLSPPSLEMIHVDHPKYSHYFGGATARGEGGFGSTGTAGNARG